MEGAYLHNLLFWKLLSENGVAVYYCLGWGIPLLFIIPWIILKARNENIYCWIKKSSKYIAMLIDVPIGLTVIVSLQYNLVKSHNKGLKIYGIKRFVFT